MLSKPTANSWSESNSASLHQAQGASNPETLARRPATSAQHLLVASAARLFQRARQHRSPLPSPRSHRLRSRAESPPRRRPHRRGPLPDIADKTTVTVIDLDTGEIIATNTIDPPAPPSATTKKSPANGQARPLESLLRRDSGETYVATHHTRCPWRCVGSRHRRQVIGDT
jgi:hypothetical protein